jgi:hypothetical protein
MKRMMEDPRMKNMEMPFDGKRMIIGRLRANLGGLRTPGAIIVRSAA